MMHGQTQIKLTCSLFCGINWYMKHKLFMLLVFILISVYQCKIPLIQIFRASRSEQSSFVP